MKLLILLFNYFQDQRDPLHSSPYDNTPQITYDLDSIQKKHGGIMQLYSELRYQVIAPPTYSLFWPQTLFFNLTKTCNL